MLDVGGRTTELLSGPTIVTTGTAQALPGGCRTQVLAIPEFPHQASSRVRENHQASSRVRENQSLARFLRSRGGPWMASLIERMSSASGPDHRAAPTGPPPA